MKPLPTKTCAACHKPRPLEAFSSSTQTRDGLRYLCRECTGDYFRAWKARRVAAHARWLGENGLAARGPGLGVGVRAPSRFFRSSREQKST
jgi:hypothetical protein